MKEDVVQLQFYDVDKFLGKTKWDFIFKSLHNLNICYVSLVLICTQNYIGKILSLQMRILQMQQDIFCFFP